MKTTNPCSSALSISNDSVTNGLPLHLGGVFFMEKPKLIRDLGIRILCGNPKWRQRFGIFKCDCGTEFEARTSQVNTGRTRSCGCLQKAAARKTVLTHGMSNTRLFGLFGSLKTRCYNTKRESYKDYGGRGITVCEEWQTDFMNFYNWAMANGYAANLKIDRINNNGNYEPGNCRWVPEYINAQNKRILSEANSSGYRGVVYFKNINRWIARITDNTTKHYLGVFSTPELAAQAYNDFVIKNRTFHPLNIIK